MKSRERERENYERVYGVLDCEIARITMEGTSILISLLSKNILCIRWKKNGIIKKDRKDRKKESIIYFYIVA